MSRPREAGPCPAGQAAAQAQAATFYPQRDLGPPLPVSQTQSLTNTRGRKKVQNHSGGEDCKEKNRLVALDFQAGLPSRPPPFVGACFPGFPSHSSTEVLRGIGLCAASAFSASLR